MTNSSDGISAPFHHSRQDSSLIGPGARSSYTSNEAWQEVVESLKAACTAHEHISARLMSENRELRRLLNASADSDGVSCTQESAQQVAFTDDTEPSELQVELHGLHSELADLKAENAQLATKYLGMKARWDKTSIENQKLKKRLGDLGSTRR